MNATSSGRRLAVIALSGLSGLVFLACGGGGAQSASDLATMAEAGVSRLPVDAAASQPDGLATPRIVFLTAAGEPVESVRYGDAVVVRAEGLAPGEEITIRARLWGYHSRAVLRADERGTVDLGRDAPLAGSSYSGVDPDGLVWSMVRQSEQREPGFDLHFALHRDQTDEVVARATLERRPLNSGLTRRDVREQGLVGTLWRPQGAGPFVGVLVLGGSEGGLASAEFSAAYLASLGHVALGLAYFGAEGLPATLSEIPLEYFATAIAWLGDQPEVDAGRLAVLGGSRGGELALMLGARFDALRAVVAVVPSGVRWGGLAWPPKSAWTLGGDPLPYMPEAKNASPAQEALAGGVTGYRYTPIFEAALAQADPAALAAATIAVEQTNGPVLMIAGDDDGVWPSCDLAQIAIDRLQQSGHAARHGDELLCFEDAGHYIGEPGWPTTEAYSVADPWVAGAHLVMGGTPGGIARAQRRADEKIRALLDSL